MKLDEGVNRDKSPVGFLLGSSHCLGVEHLPLGGTLSLSDR